MNKTRKVTKVKGKKKKSGYIKTQNTKRNNEEKTKNSYSNFRFMKSKEINVNEWIKVEAKNYVLHRNSSDSQQFRYEFL